MRRTGIEETIDRALDEVVRADLRRRLAERVRSGNGVDRGDEVLAASRSTAVEGKSNTGTF